MGCLTKYWDQKFRSVSRISFMGNYYLGKCWEFSNLGVLGKFDGNKLFLSTLKIINKYKINIKYSKTIFNIFIFSHFILFFKVFLFIYFWWYFWNYCDIFRKKIISGICCDIIMIIFLRLSYMFRNISFQVYVATLSQYLKLLPILVIVVMTQEILNNDIETESGGPNGIARDILCLIAGFIFDLVGWRNYLITLVNLII